MLGNLTALAIASFISVGSYAYSVAVPKPPTIASPLPINKPRPTVTPTPTPLPTGRPTATPTPLPTAPPTGGPTPLPPTSTPTTPEPTSEPTAPPLPIVTSSDLESLFERYAGEFSVDKELLKRIASCESGFNSNAENGDYQGMFQFAASSWTATRQAMGMDTNPDLRKNAEESIKAAAFKVAHNGVNAWPSCSKG